MYGKYYLSVPCVGCPWVSKGLKGQACLTVLCFSLYTLASTLQPHLSKHAPFIDLRRQKRTNTWSIKQRVHSAQQKQTFPVLASLVKMRVGRGNI